MRKILDKYPELKPPFSTSIQAAANFNFGPNVVTLPHLDSPNLAHGWCSIISLGDYNYKLGGHLVIWGIKVILEFPPRHIVQMPSASLPHSNLPIRAQETRSSITTYTAGGLFRHVAYGFRKEEHFAAQDPVGFAKMKAAKGERWAAAIDMFSKHNELEADVRCVFGVKSKSVV